MIFRPTLSGFLRFQIKIMRGALLAPLVLLPFALYEDIVIIQNNNILNGFAIFLMTYCFGIFIFYLVLGIQFSNRTDEYIYESYFDIKSLSATYSQLKEKLLSMGYIRIEENESMGLFEKSSAVIEGVGVGISEKRTWFVKVYKNDSNRIHFFIKGNTGFDGRQIASRAAQEFLRK